MKMEIIRKIRNWIKFQFDLYDIQDLQVGGHCGCCGTWNNDRIVPKRWAIYPAEFCEKCRSL